MQWLSSARESLRDPAVAFQVQRHVGEPADFNSRAIAAAISGASALGNFLERFRREQAGRGASPKLVKAKRAKGSLTSLDQRQSLMGHFRSIRQWEAKQAEAGRPRR